MAFIRTLLVDDNSEFLEAATRFLSSDSQIKIVGATASGEEALQKVISLNPDLILMDLALPGLNGLETTRKLKAKPDAPRVVILTLHDNYEYRKASEAARADGFVPKSEFGVKLLPLIRTLFSEESFSVPQQ
jgi:DNA-binding NarL/FixJ family response regulator